MSDAILKTESVSACFALQHGGRLSSFILDGKERLIGARDGATMWGCFPMVPWAGRVGHGRFQWRDRRVDLPLNLPPHALHGTVFDTTWTQCDAHHYRTNLGPDWPWSGHVESTVQLTPGEMTWTLTVFAHRDSMPVTMGWHPWFARRVAEQTTATLHFEPRTMFERDASHLPTGLMVTPGHGPFDDCFSGQEPAPRIEWSDGWSLEVSSTCGYWVVYDEPSEGFCVEPQSAPPDAFNQFEYDTVSPAKPLSHSMTWRWWKR